MVVRRYQVQDLGDWAYNDLSCDRSERESEISRAQKCGRADVALHPGDTRMVCDWYYSGPLCGEVMSERVQQGGVQGGMGQ